MYVVYVYSNASDAMVSRAECDSMKHAISMMSDHVEIWCKKPDYRVTVTYEKNSN